MIVQMKVEGVKEGRSEARPRRHQEMRWDDLDAAEER